MSDYIYKEPSLSYKILTTSIIIAFIIIVILGSFLIAPKIGYTLFYLVVLCVLALLIALHVNYTAYICKSCGHEFEITFWTDLITAHSPGKKLLRCPKCSVRDYVTELVKLKTQ